MDLIDKHEAPIFNQGLFISAIHETYDRQINLINNEKFRAGKMTSDSDALNGECDNDKFNAWFMIQI